MMNIGTVIRNSPEPYLRRIIRRIYSSGPDANGTSVRSQPGILIFSRRQQLLHVNRQALELVGHLDQTEIRPATDIPVTSVQELRMVIQQTLDQRTAANIWGSFELEGAVFDLSRRILIRGFGLADRDSHDHSRIVIVLDAIGLQGEDKASRSRPSIPTPVPPAPRA